MSAEMENDAEELGHDPFHNNSLPYRIASKELGPDIATSGLAAALEPDFYGNVEARFARMLKPKVYNRGGNYLSYGAKLVPSTERLELNPQQQEFIEIFKK